MRSIAIIGGGPKAASLATKLAAACEVSERRNKRLPSVRLVVIEPNEIGGNWNGKNGYTNGHQQLCTPALRDLGFPYQNFAVDKMLDPEINATMLKEYSWPAFLTTASPTIVENSMAYGNWVSKQCPRPSHSEFARYLKWAFEKAMSKFANRIELLQCTLTEIDFDKNTNKWLLEVEENGELHYTKKIKFDEIIITGASDTSEPLINIGSEAHENGRGIAVQNQWFFTGKTFWEEGNLSRLRKLLSDASVDDTGGPSVIVVGSGGTAAAILKWLSDFNLKNLRVVGRKSYIDSRAPNYFSDRLYHDEVEWGELPLANKDAVLKNLERGRVWCNINDEISTKAEFKYVVGSVEAASFLASESSEMIEENPELFGEIDSSFLGNYELEISIPGKEKQSCHILIDARSFDSWWFLKLLTKRTKGLLPKVDLEVGKKYSKKKLRELKAANLIPDNLNLKANEIVAAKNILEVQKWHILNTISLNQSMSILNNTIFVPNITGIVAPYSGNLMALGALSNRILRRHLMESK